MRYLQLLLLVVLTSSCSSISVLSQKKEKRENTELEFVPLVFEERVVEAPKEAQQQQVQVSQSALEKESKPKKASKALSASEPQQKRSPLALRYSQKHFDFWVNYFTKRERDRFERHLQNGENVRPLVEKILESHGLPGELFYVALIESGFNTHIRSRAQAVGPWQFIKGTAKRYKLRVDSYLDERVNIYKATHAAANYLKDLYNIFGSWELALCAYNAGEYGIINAIRRGNTRDYNTLVKLKLIPRETIQYIPKVAAALYLSKNRNKYNINVKTTEVSPFEDVKKITVKNSFNVSTVARTLGISHKQLKSLNPDLKRGWIRSYRKGTELFVPKSANVKVSKLSKVLKRERRTASVTRAKWYRVKRGDNLYKIARTFDVSVQELKRTNRLRSSKIMIGQRLKVPGTVKVYVVRKGDNLSKIAKRFGTSISSLVRMNELKSKVIFPHQKLHVPYEG